MDENTFQRVYLALVGISYITAFIVGVVGWVCLKPKKMLRTVFPYIKKSGNHNVIFGFIIKKRSIRLHYSYLICLVANTLLNILLNAVVTTSTKYNPYDGLDCFGISYNGSKFEVESEEQAKMENVTGITWYGWNFDIGGAIGHAAAILTLSWLFTSIVLWIKLKLHYKAINCIKNGKSCYIKALGYSGYVTLILFQFFFVFCTLAAVIGSFFIIVSFNLPINNMFDISLLFFTTFCSGILIFPSTKKPKSLAEHCKEAVEGRQGEEEGALVPIRNRLRRVHDHQIRVDRQVDRLEELAELACKKALADIEEEMETISEDEMKTIAQIAYRKVAPDEGEENNNDQRYNTRQGASINDPTERDRLLENT